MAKAQTMYWSKDKEKQEKEKWTLLIASALLVTIISSVTPAWASDNIFSAMDSGLPSVLEQVKTTWNNTIFPILLVVYLIASALCGSNTRAADTLKSAVKWTLFVALGINLVSWAGTTITWIANKINGGGSAVTAMVVDTVTKLV